ncbi:MAG: phosphoribosyl-AMP cyclohydrolase [Alphaproteobacteria bacterium]|nr:phosphoribosyl-AMP cyclohydrolase [Alphaproteobacteria bacterium]
MGAADSLDALLARVKFGADGLVPAVAQQHDTGEVLMLAWMSAESLRATLSSRRVTYWSRSRKSLWRKGDTSGHEQHLVDLRLDCDGDAILLLVDQAGPACHLERRSCFFTALRDGAAVDVPDAEAVPTGARGRT